MSDTASPTPPPTTPPTPPTAIAPPPEAGSTAANWGPVLISGYVVTLMLAALVLNAFLIKNETVTTVLITGIATNFTAVCQYWVGSSHGSQKKDAVFSAMLKSSPPPPPSHLPTV